ncbi:NAD(P)-dependent oxidoreductase [Streptomyces durbertensis]|uniref:NAD(P)-dependent oxidoreductase n=1 Tax=Streptomyces durbertensis TaxID=2448886 RepID=A0ABR6ELJ9_9ACTN|nr:NAD(P)-binding domain-containing protein [Streptomyces durbertensis]MBB1246204.1 NAD(P)-dependent oxidoreductase [Streptomyces durbertensis]
MTGEAKKADGSGSDVSVLGLGAMGRELARALLDAGHRVTVWNRTAARAEPLVDKGALAAGSPAEAVGASPLTVVCLLDEDSVLDVLDGVELAGRDVVDLTNGTPGQARRVAELVRARGGGYLDGGIMAVPPMIGGPHAFLYYSGSERVFREYRALLDAFGAGHYKGADPGAAALWDVALLSAMYGMFGGVLHAFALVRSAGIDAREVAGDVGTWLAAMGAAAPEYARRIDTGDHTGDVVSNLGMQAAGIRNVLATAEEQGVSTALLSPLADFMRLRLAGGDHATEDLTGLVQLLAPGAELAAQPGAK